MLDPQKVVITATDNGDWIQIKLEDSSFAWIYLDEGQCLRKDDVLEPVEDPDGSGDRIWTGLIFDGLDFCD